MDSISIDQARSRKWDVVVAGSSFASMFFVYALPAKLDVLIIEKGRIRDHQDLIEDNLSANVCRYLFYFDFFAGGNSILLAAGFYDRVHCLTPGL